MNLSCTIKIGRTSIDFHCAGEEWLRFIKKYYAPFLSPPSRGSSFSVRLTGELKPVTGRKTLVVGRNNGKWLIKRHDFISTSSREFERTDLAVEKNKYAFDSWLRIFFTLCGTVNGSLLLHGAGFSSRGGTFVFPGRSGRGKSTMIRILGKNGALTDELVCVYAHKNSANAASTPFWGELKKGTGRIFKGRLCAVLFLKHGSRTSLKLITKSEALRGLLKTALFFSRDTGRVSKLLDYARRIAGNTPSYAITFRKNSARKEILALLRRAANDKKN